MGKYFVILLNPSNGFPIPLVDDDDDLMLFTSKTKIYENENPLIKMGSFLIYDLDAGILP